MADEDAPKRYGPSSEVKEYVLEKLQFLLRERSLKTAGEELDEADKRTDRRLRVTKNRILDRTFQQMADLVFLLESLSSDEELAQLFEDDLKELIGIRYEEKVPSEWALKTSLIRFTRAFTYSSNGYCRTNAIHAMLSTSLDKLEGDLRTRFESKDVYNVVKSDLDRVRAWNNFNREIDSKDDGTPHRLFQIPKLRVKEPKGENPYIDVLQDGKPVEHITVDINKKTA